MSAGEHEVRMRGGMRNRRGNATWPLASLFANRDQVVIKCLIGGARFSPDQVTVSFKQGLISSGVRFYPEAPGLDPVTFWTGRHGELMRRLHELGWNVEGLRTDH